MSKKEPVKIDLKIELTTPEVKMCDCGAECPHAAIVAGDFRSMPFGAKKWGRGLLKTEEVEIFGDFILDELRQQMELLPLPETGPEKVQCEKYDEHAGREILFCAQDEPRHAGEAD